MKKLFSILVISTMYICTIVAETYKGTLQLSNGTYTGLILNKLPNGIGDIEYNNGHSYHGQWLNGKRHGYGRLNYESGSVFWGYWKDDEINGPGKWEGVNGNSFEGLYKNGIREGYGKYYWKNGNRFEGLWENDERNGFGIFFWANGNKFLGIWQNHKREGFGALIYADGSIKAGFWENDEYVGRNGIKESSWEGDHYIGQLTDNEFNGFGIYQTIDGICCGYWNMGMFKIGIEFFSEGYCIGEYDRDGYRDYGVFADHKGTFFYLGDFFSDKPSGKGLVVTKEGALQLLCYYDGQWLNGVKSGYGAEYNMYMYYEGQWKNGELNGEGKMIMMDGVSYLHGQYIDGEPEGEHYYFKAGQQTTTTTVWIYKNGEKTGERQLQIPVKATSIAKPKTTTQTTSNTINGHEYVDLGLPSGTLWATCNLGATRPEQYGGYYAWGETTSKQSFSWANYRWSMDWSGGITKYCGEAEYGNVDNKTKLELSDDAARVHWGGRWRIPTEIEFNELGTKCTWQRTTQNGISGYKVTGPNGKYIFILNAGWYYPDKSNVGSLGVYWCSNLNLGMSTFGRCYHLNDTGRSGAAGTFRYNGLSIRPVASPY